MTFIQSEIPSLIMQYISINLKPLNHEHAVTNLAQWQFSWNKNVLYQNTWLQSCHWKFISKQVQGWAKLLSFISQHRHWCCQCLFQLFTFSFGFWVLHFALPLVFRLVWSIISSGCESPEVCLQFCHSLYLIDLSSALNA